MGLKKLSATLALALAATLARPLTPAFAEDPPPEPPAGPVLDQDLTDKITSYLETKNGDYAVTVRELTGQQRYVDIRSNKKLEPASTIKTFYAFLALRRVDLGKLSLKKKLPSGLTLKTCMRLMISVSDNDCSADIREFLGNAYVNKTLAKLGYASTFIVLNTDGSYKTKRTTTGDLATLLTDIENQTTLSKESNDLLKKYLSMQVWRARVSSSVPKIARVWSKSGELMVNSGMVEGDTAIVHGPTTSWVITVLGWHDAVNDAVRKVSALTYTQFEGAFDKPMKYPSYQFVATKDTPLYWSADGAVALTIPKGNNVKFKHSYRNWWWVYYRGTNGYVKYQFLKLRPEYLWPHAV